MQIAVAQVPSLADKTQVLDMIGRTVDDTDADLIVFPEGVMHAFDPGIDLAQVAEPLDGRFVGSLRALAGSAGTWVVAGCWELVPGESRVYNTLVVVDDAGGLAATYRKIHLFDSFGFHESERVLPGEPQPVVFDIGELRFGLMTCYDLRFPELARRLTEAGSHVLLLPAGWVAGEHKLDHWRTLTRSRAIENTAYLAAAGLCGGIYTGHSVIIDPMGVVIGELGDAPGSLVAEIDGGFIESVRKRVPSLEHRRL